MAEIATMFHINSNKPRRTLIKCIQNQRYAVSFMCTQIGRVHTCPAYIKYTVSGNADKMQWRFLKTDKSSQCARSIAPYLSCSSRHLITRSLIVDDRKILCAQPLHSVQSFKSEHIMTKVAIWTEYPAKNQQHNDDMSG